MIDCNACEVAIEIADRQCRAAALRLDTHKSISFTVACPACGAVWTVGRPGAGALQLPPLTAWKLHRAGDA
jgi:hypothetical protein